MSLQGARAGRTWPPRMDTAFSARNLGPLTRGLAGGARPERDKRTRASLDDFACGHRHEARPLARVPPITFSAGSRGIGGHCRAAPQFTPWRGIDRTVRHPVPWRDVGQRLLAPCLGTLLRVVRRTEFPQPEVLAGLLKPRDEFVAKPVRPRLQLVEPVVGRVRE